MDNGNGGFTTVTNNGQPVVSTQVPAVVHGLRGRTTTLPVFLNDAMITVTGGQVNFNTTTFNNTNLDPATQSIKTFISDFVEFDITNVPNKPKLKSGASAARVYFSGENIALSEAPIGGKRGTFEELTANTTKLGVFTMPVALGTGVAPGTYTLVEQNLGDLTGLSKSMSLLGTWRDYNEVLVNLGTLEFVTFPNGTDSPKQQLVVLARNGAGAITDFYFGVADLQAQKFKVFPIANVVSGVATTPISGTLSGLVDQNNAAVTSAVSPIQVGAVRAGTFTVTSGQNANVKGTGKFHVFRV